MVVYLFDELSMYIFLCIFNIQVYIYIHIYIDMGAGRLSCNKIPLKNRALARWQKIQKNEFTVSNNLSFFQYFIINPVWSSLARSGSVRLGAIFEFFAARTVD